VVGAAVLILGFGLLFTGRVVPGCTTCSSAPPAGGCACWAGQHHDVGGVHGGSADPAGRALLDQALDSIATRLVDEGSDRRPG